ncbi:MAG: EAL domain-containing protein [Burkholderiaceae bacterium]|nr:EAL domain-containing protein [Burkholderiaceae bacterium]
MSTVLVVDDVLLNRELVATLLHYAGHAVVEAADGEEALAQVRKHRPDLVICDILMPTMDGYEFARRLREDPVLGATEVIFYTATFLEREAQALAASCGVSRVLTKPCEPEEILAAVGQSLAHINVEAVQTFSDASFDQEHLRLITDKLMEKAEELEHANRRLAALNELSLHLSSERNPQQLLERFCRGVRTLFGAHGAVMAVRDTADSGVVQVFTAGMSEEEVLRAHSLALAIAPQGRESARISKPSGAAPAANASAASPLAAALAAQFPGAHSGLLAPLVSLHHDYGWVLLIDKLGADGFSDEDERTLSVQAAQAGRIYENGSLFARVQQQVQLLQVQAEERARADVLLRLEHAVARALASAEDMAVGVTAVLRVVCESQQWEFARFWWADDTGGVLRMTAQWSAPGMATAESDPTAPMRVLRKGEGLAGRVWESAQPIWVSDLSHDPRVVQRDVLASGGNASANIVPVISGGQTLGVLSFLVSGSREPDERVQASAQIVGHQLGQFLRRKLAEQRIQRLHRVSTVLSEINSLIVRVGARDELFGEACRIAVETGRFKKAWIGVFQHDPWQLDLVAVHSDPPTDSGHLPSIHEALQPQFRDGGAEFECVVQRRQPIFENDIAGSNWMAMRERALVAGARSLAVLPLVVAGDTVGLLVLHSQEVGFFDDEERKLLLELAGNLSFAMDHLAQTEQINRLAYYDVLTGHANGMLFRERLAQHLSAAQGRSSLVLAMVDIERFKSINDALGRHVGDDILRQVGQRIANNSEGPSHMARVGPDQFAVMFPEASAEIEVARLLNEFYQRCFGGPFAVGSTELRVAARIGVALFPTDGGNAETLYRNAEAAVKRAKSAVERVLFYDVRMTESLAEKLALENRLRGALQNEQFVLHYQPKVDCVSRRVEGVEALIRWQDPELGLVPPGKFIPLMEETGLIVEVGAWALRKAAADHQAWRAQGRHAPRIAVNVSAIQLQRKDFVSTVEAALGPAATAPGIDLEITESAIVENIDDTVSKLHALRALGLNIAIDDFGTGYSSLSYLAKLPVQVLKIDQSFVSAMLADADAQTLVASMVSLAHALRMKVVAEGVETDEQAERLKLLRCDVIQGFLISKPMSSERLLAWLDVHVSH